jgi:hypothetical protein
VTSLWRSGGRKYKLHRRWSKSACARGRSTHFYLASTSRSCCMALTVNGTYMASKERLALGIKLVSDQKKTLQLCVILCRMLRSYGAVIEIEHGAALLLSGGVLKAHNLREISYLSQNLLSNLLCLEIISSPSSLLLYLIEILPKSTSFRSASTNQPLHPLFPFKSKKSISSKDETECVLVYHELQACWIIVLGRFLTAKK